MGQGRDESSSRSTRIREKEVVARELQRSFCTTDYVNEKPLCVSCVNNKNTRTTAQRRQRQEQCSSTRAIRIEGRQEQDKLTRKEGCIIGRRIVLGGRRRIIARRSIISRTRTNRVSTSEEGLYYQYQE